MKGSERVNLILNEVRFDRDQADEVRAHLVLSAHALIEDGGDETTEWTRRAKTEAANLADELSDDEQARFRTAQFVEIGGETILLEVVGQTPDLVRYRQGLRPERLAFLYRMERAGIPVLLAFYHGFWELAWLASLPEPESIARSRDGDRETARVGWYAGEDEDRAVFYVREAFDFPPREPLRSEPYEAVRLTDGLG